MVTLGYALNIRSFRKGFDFCNSHVFPYFYYIHDYYPKRYTDVDNEIEEVRKIVYAFKDGYNPTFFANLMSDAISDAIEKEEIFKKLKLKLNNTCLVVIPASSPSKNELRFSKFCEELSTNLKIENGYKAIWADEHEPTKGRAGGNKIENFHFDPKIYTNKVVLLFDDVRTSGTTYKQTAAQLIKSGAIFVIGIFLAKTTHPRIQLEDDI